LFRSLDWGADFSPIFPISCQFKPRMVISATSEFSSVVTCPASLKKTSPDRLEECRLYGDRDQFWANRRDLETSWRDTIPMHPISMNLEHVLNWYEQVGTHQRVEVLLPGFVPIDQILCAVVACKLSPDVCEALQAVVPHVVFVESEEASRDFQVRLFRERARCQHTDASKFLPRSTVAASAVAQFPPNTEFSQHSAEMVCELVSADGSTHRSSCAMLANASPYFKAAFSSGLKEATSRRFQVPAPSSVVEAVLLYQSKGKFDETCTIIQVLEVSKLAHYWELHALMRLCFRLIADKLHSDNVIADASLGVIAESTKHIFI
jgi:hypothetical protein